MKITHQMKKNLKNQNSIQLFSMHVDISVCFIQVMGSFLVLATHEVIFRCFEWFHEVFTFMKLNADFVLVSVQAHWYHLGFYTQKMNFSFYSFLLDQGIHLRNLPLSSIYGQHPTTQKSFTTPYISKAFLIVFLQLKPL